MHHPRQRFEEGDRFPLGPVSLDRAGVIAFAAEFDPQPFHLEDDAADASMLGGLSASGWHSCALMMRMMRDGFLDPGARLASVESIRWLRPVRPGDVLAGEAAVIEAGEQNAPRLRNTLANADGDPVLVCDYTLDLSNGDA